MVPMDVDWWLLLSKGAYWCLRESMGVGRWLLVSEGAFRCLSVPTGD